MGVFDPEGAAGRVLAQVLEDAAAVGALELLRRRRPAAALTQAADLADALVSDDDHTPARAPARAAALGYDLDRPARCSTRARSSTGWRGWPS